MLKYNAKCNVCKLVKDNPDLLTEIFNTKHYRKTSSVTVTQLAEKYNGEFSLHSLRNHTQRHQFLSEAKFTDRHLKDLAKKVEQNIVRRSIESKEVFDSIIEQGMTNLENGDMSVDTKDLLQAAKLKKEFQLKEQDQSMAMAEMMWHFASGENENSKAYDRRFVENKAVTDYDPTADPTEDSERRTMESRSFYESLAGDAPSPRAD